MDSIEQCIVERAHHEQELQNRLKRLSERKLQIQECKIQKVKASDASSGETNYSRIVSDKGNDQGLENQSNTSGDESSRSRNECNDKSTFGDDTDIIPSYDIEPMVEVDSNVIPNSPDMCDNEIQTDHNAIECDDERVALANLIADLKRDIDENKTIQKQLKKANASLTQELKECKSTLVVTSRTLGESNIDFDKLERKLNETLGLLAQKDIDIKEGLKVKAYEISVVKEKHNELVKQSLLTKSHYEGLVKKNKVRKSSFAKPYDVNAPGPSRNSLKHVSFQSPRESVGSNDMVHNYYLEEAKKKAQLQKDKALNTKPSVQQSVRLPNTANGNKPKPRNFNQQPRNWPPSMSSRVSNTTINTSEPPRNQKSFLKSKDLACPTCKKCIYSANHDECILKYLSKVNSRASAQKKDAQSHKTTKRYIPVEKKSDSKNHGRQIPIGQRFSPNKSSNVYLKTTPPRSGLTWKPTGRIFTQVGLKWIPIRKSVETRYNTNDSASPLGKETHNPKTVICANSSSLSADNNPFFKEKENVRFSAFHLSSQREDNNFLDLS
ncbi:hypothetical protein Tco_0550652 [Tanacetum coccineum]